MTNKYFKVKGGLEVPDADDFWIGETLTPSIRPSLLLDFAKGKALDGRVNFSRNSTATYYDGKSTSKAEENLILYSEQFSNATWGGSGLSVTDNSITAPDGNLTADTITATSGGTFHYIQQSQVATAAIYTASVYMKAGTSNYGCLRIATDGGNNRYGVVVDLTNGSVVTGISGTPVGYSNSVVAIGNGWYRIVATATNTSGVVYAGVAVSNIASPIFSAAFPSWSASGTESVYVWGAQLEQRSFAGAYTPTITTTATTYIPVLKTASINGPRFNHDPLTGESLGLLIEPTATNLLLYSAEFDNVYWTKSNSNITLNAVISPDGTLSGDLLVESTSNSTHHTQPFSSNLAVTENSSLCLSVFVKRKERTIVRVWDDTNNTKWGAYFDVGSGTLGTVAPESTATITHVGNGWYRCCVTYVNTTNLSRPRIGLASANGTYSYTGDGYSGLYIWGAQLEESVFPTSYIPTTSTTVTRQADGCTVTLGSWYNANEGTWFANAKTNRTDNNTTVISAATGTSNRINLSTSQILGQSLAYIGNNVTTQFTRSFTTNSTTFRKVALAYSSTSTNQAEDGLLPSTDRTDCVIPIIANVRIGSISTINSVLNGHVKKIAYYPKRLSNQEIVDMTE